MLLDTTPECIDVAAQKLLQGLLVAFPTETVYGLGADATNESAARRIYEVKGRPPTDPLICHVPEISAVMPLWDTTSDRAKEVASLGVALGSFFWPGPITIVARASTCVAPCVTGGSGYVGVRIPKYDVALRFLRAAGVPVAAPSANTFGHVSPTTAKHVHDDLAQRDATLTILDGGCRCDVGIESTVVKLLDDAQSIEVLRRGKIGISDIMQAIHHMDGGRWAGKVKVSVRDNRSNFQNRAAPPMADGGRSVLSGEEPMDGPGQLLTHYAPHIPSFLVTPASFEDNTTQQSAASSSTGTGCAGPSVNSRYSLQVPGLPNGHTDLGNVVILDFQGAILERLFCRHAISKATYEACRGTSTESSSSVMRTFSAPRDIAAYRSLSSSGCVEEASRAVFDALRWVESVPGASAAIFPLLSEWIVSSPPTCDASEAQQLQHHSEAWLDLLAAVEDRLFRAASGVVAEVAVNTTQI